MILLNASCMSITANAARLRSSKAGCLIANLLLLFGCGARWRLRARYPGRPPQIAQHLRPGGQPRAHKLLVLRRSGLVAEWFLFVEYVKLFDQRVGASQIIPDLLARFFDHASMADERQQVVYLNVRLD